MVYWATDAIIIIINFYSKRRKLCVNFICAIHAGSGLPQNKNLTHLHLFVHKNTHKILLKNRTKKIHLISIEGASSIKTYNKTTAQFFSFTKLERGAPDPLNLRLNPSLVLLLLVTHTLKILIHMMFLDYWLA